MYYVTQQDVEKYLGVSLTANGVATFGILQQALQDTVDTYCNRSWNIGQVQTDYFNAYTDTNPPTLIDTFFPKYSVDPTAYDPNHPQAGGVRIITIGEINGQGGTPLD